MTERLKNLPKKWQTEQIVNNYNVKLFTKLSIYADKDVKVSINYDNRTTSFVTYTSGLNEFAFRVIGKDVNVEISSELESAVVKNLKLEYYEY